MAEGVKLSQTILLPGKAEGGVRLSQTQIYAVAGFTSGLLQAAIFNPWDRALYLSVKNHSRFLSFANFRNPYQGFSQSICSRVLSGGSYFPLVDIFEPLIAKKFDLKQDSAVNKALAGHAAGAVNGVCINFLTAIKYETWGQAEANKAVGKSTAPSMIKTAIHMYQAARRGNFRREFREAGYFRSTYREANRGRKPSLLSHPRHPLRMFLWGFRPFTKGIVATVIRDAMFGGSFAIIKCYTKPAALPSSHPPSTAHRLLDNGSILLAGATATIASAPWNYARNIKYATPPGQPIPSIWCCLRDLFRDARTADCGTLKFLQQRLRIGWGTARVACGMAVGFQLYEQTKNFLEQESLGPTMR
jgi:hypothetical protein